MSCSAQQMFLALGKVELQPTILQIKVAVEVYTFCGAIYTNQLLASYCMYAVVPASSSSLHKLVCYKYVVRVHD